MNEVLKVIHNIGPEQKVVIGCSGGPDSMCLLDLITNNLDKKNIICAHVNHNIREESKEELEFVKDYCNTKDIVFESIVLPNDKKYNEEELRKMRYDFFEDVLKKHNATYLLTAHHGDDLTETILMRITRGSSLKGYAGIEIESQKKDYKILRPLLHVTKTEIEEYLKENNIKSVHDKTNDSDNYTRNRYRHHILPKLKEENKDIHKKFIKFSKELLNYYEFVNNIVEEDIKQNGYPKYCIDNFDTKDKLIQKKIIEKYLDMYYGNDINLLNDKHVKQIIDLVLNKNNKSINLPLNKKMIKEYNFIYIINNVEEKKEKTDITFNNIYEDDNHIFEIIKESDKKSNYIIRLHTEEISMPLHLKSVEDGDKIKVKNLGGHKKVKDILINEKIVKDKRNNLLLLTDNNGEILWVPGIKKSEFDKSNTEKYDIIIKYTEKCVNTKEK